jgi:hypothetical protein
VRLHLQRAALQQVLIIQVVGMAVQAVAELITLQAAGVARALIIRQDVRALAVALGAVKEVMHFHLVVAVVVLVLVIVLVCQVVLDYWAVEVAHLKIHSVPLELLELVLAMAGVAVLMVAVAQVRQVLLLLNGKRINYEKSNY